MLLTAKIRLVNPLLGGTRFNDNIRRFKKTRDGKIDIDPTHWNWAFQQAADSLHYDVDYSALSPESGIRSPKIDFYNRKFLTRKGGKEVPGSEMHEAIKAGVVLTFDLAILAPQTPQKAMPTVLETKDMLGFVGAFVGISQWGNRLGYGRFDLESLELK